MVARHEHGFKNENRIINKHGLKGAEGYTDKWDAIAPRASTGHGKHQKMYFNVPVQIKTIREGGSVDMGDVFRHSKTNEDFILHVDFYNKKDKSKIVESHILYIEVEKWKPLFKFEGYDFLRKCLNEITNAYSDDLKWKGMISEMKERWGDRPVKLAPKRDHKKQKRIQCTIPNRKFYNEIVPVFKKATYIK